MHTSRIHSSVCQILGKMNIRELCGHVTGTPMGCTGASNPRKLLTWDTPNGNTLSLHVHLPLSDQSRQEYGSHAETKGNK